MLLLVEDNPGDARLLREMLNEQGAHNTELIACRRIGEAEEYLAGARRSISSCSTSACPTRRGSRPCAARTRPRRASRWSC